MKKHTELYQRMYTAIPLAFFVVSAIFFLRFNHFLVLVITLFNLAAWEWTYLCNYSTGWQRYIYIVLLNLGFMGGHYCPMRWIYMLATVIGIGSMLNVIWVMKQPTRPIYSQKVLAGLGWIALIVNYRTLLFLKAFPFYLALGLWIIIWTDTLAYFIGRTWGKITLAPLISPNKTWEGCIGGIIGAITVTLLTLILVGYAHKINYYFVVLLLITTITAQAGDLFESIVKRQRAVKDSGQWLPGHGGIWDRLDSIIVALPIFMAGIFFWRPFMLSALNLFN